MEPHITFEGPYNPETVKRIAENKFEGCICNIGCEGRDKVLESIADSPRIIKKVHVIKSKKSVDIIFQGDGPEDILSYDQEKYAKDKNAYDQWYIIIAEPSAPEVLKIFNNLGE